MSIPPTRSWRRILPVVFVICSLFALVFLPLAVRQRTNLIREQMRAAIGPARAAAELITRAIGEQRSAVISFQATEQPHFVAIYHRTRAAEEDAYRRLDGLAPQLGPLFGEKYAQLRSSERAWHLGIERSELIRRPLPAPVTLQRLFEIQPQFARAAAAAAELENAIRLESQTRQRRIAEAESMNARISLALALLALVAAIIVAWIGRQIRLLALAAEAGRDDAARETARAMEARQAAEEAHARAAFLSDASRELSLSLEIDAMLQRVAEISVPVLGDFCLIDLAFDGSPLRRVAAAHRNPSKRTFIDQLGREPVYAGLPELRSALEADRPVAVTDLTPEMKRTICGEDQRLAEILDPRSILVAPLLARGRTPGAMVFVSAESRRTFGTEDIALAWDFSRRVALAVDNARLYHESQQALRSREEILAIVSHDLRSPLTTISMTATVLQEMPPDEQDLVEHMEVIRTSAKRMTRLINDLLDVTRIDVGHKLPIEASRIEVEPLVRELMEIFSPQAEARGVSLTADAKLAGAHARADRDRLIQAMSNIIGNALKFTPEGGSISLRVTSEDGMIHLAVSDTGPGIPEENLSHIWDPYWQMNRNARMGAGLGLAIVKGIVDAHGGRITVDSSAGSGTTFDVAIPGDLVTSDE